MNIGENIKNFRTFRGISQQKLAEMLGKSKSVISNWERGENSPDLDSCEKMCKIFRVNPNELFGWEVNPEYAEHARKMEQFKADLAALEEERERIERQIHNVETAMWQKENPLLDIDCDN